MGHILSYIDISSVSILIIIIHIIQAASLLMQFLLNKTYKGNGWWLIWSVLIVAGLTFLHLRYITWLTPHAIFLQNSFLILGLIFLYAGIMRFFERKENGLILYSAYGIYEILYFYFIYFKDDVHIRSVIFAAAMLFIAAVTAYALFRYRFTSVRFTANVMGIIMSVHGSFYLLRLYYLFTHPNSGSYMNQDWNTTLMYVSGMIAGLFFTFSLIFMVNQKLGSDMRSAKERFETMFSTSPDAVLITCLTDGRLVNVNNAFTTVTGLTKEEALDKTTVEINFWKSEEHRQAIAREIIKKGGVENVEFEYRKKDGKKIYGLLSSKTIMLDGTLHSISVFKDITRRIEAENELKVKNEELEAVNSEKDKLFSIISHDLKNSFNIFLGYTDLLAEDINGLNRTEINLMAKNMNTSARNLYKLLENLLEWSVFKRGLTKVSPESISLHKFMEETVVHIKEAADEKNINIGINVPYDIFVLTDKPMAEIIVRNLLTNAVKFTPRNGTVSISSERTTSDKVSIAIKDTGIGMSDEIKNSLFSPGKESKRKGTDNEPSTGLGLMLVKEYTAKLGGTISVESVEGKGSTFTLTLPAP